MTQILVLLDGEDYLPFESFFDLKEGRIGVVVSFLTLIKEPLVELIQAEPFLTIHVKVYL